METVVCDMKDWNLLKITKWLWPEWWGNAASLQGNSFSTGHKLPLG